MPPINSEDLDRREVLKLMAASFALAGLGACTRQPVEKIVPYVRSPEEIVPGQPLFFATAMPLGGAAIGLLAESHMGRPTKIEGNPQHPGSLGATDAFAQASILTLYDPDRSQVVTRDGRISSWMAFIGALNQELARRARLSILTETVISPTLAWQIRELLKQNPAAKWRQYEPVVSAQTVRPIYRFDLADVVLSLDADFLSNVRYARDFAERRRRLPETNRLYVVEPMPSPTGSLADHRLAMRSGEVEAFARAVAAGQGPVAQDLNAHRGSSLVVAGDYQPVVVHALAAQMNHALGNVGRTVVYTEPVEAQPVDQIQSLRELVADMNAGNVDLLVIIGGNPVYTAPADLGFVAALKKVKLRAHLGLYEDETSALCQWHIPEAHYLESWGDTRAYDGTVTIQQPLIAPLYGGKSAYELVAALAGSPDRSSHDIVQEYWRAQKPGAGFDVFWQTALHDGVVPGSAAKEVEDRRQEIGDRKQETAGLEIVFRPDPAIWDGRFANNGWLQELPKPVTKLTWDNATHLSPATARQLGLANEDVVELRYRGRTVGAPVWIVPGHADDSVTVHLGYGRTRGGRLAVGAGFNAYALRCSDAPWSDFGLEIRKTGRRYALACTQQHHSLEGRDHVRVRPVAEFAKREPLQELSLYPEYKDEGYAWGMAIDLNACTGCSACVVACQAENNIPVVGKDQVARGREMHWLRIDRYEQGPPEHPDIYHEPMLCQHCENAPCELVCPVNATVHSSEGLNQMVYNRCVGTRYCSNNCPYKVRRFNFLLYADWNTPSLWGLRNPEVTVRSRGVMEKCTYCVQRINRAKIEAEKQNRSVRDGEIVTACEAACPTRAIVFGNIKDRNSRVAKLRGDPRNYSVLGDLNTRPRTTYLARLRNPNPGAEKA